MSQMIIDPPINITSAMTWQEDNFDGQLHIYLAYDYLPSRNFYLLSKNVNELYEFIFEIIHDRPVTDLDFLVLGEVNTGNSIEVLFKILEVINPPKYVWIPLSIVTGLIYGHATYLDNMKKSAETELIIANTRKIYSETDLIKSQIEKSKIELEEAKLKNKRLILEKSLIKQNISEDYRNKILITENLKKISRKLNSIENQIMNKPINVAIVNGVTVYNNNIMDIK